MNYLAEACVHQQVNWENIVGIVCGSIVSSILILCFFGVPWGRGRERDEHDSVQLAADEQGGDES